MNQKIKEMELPKRMIVDGVMRTVHLTDYVESSDCYEGTAMCNEGTGASTVLTKVVQARPYPYEAQPLAAFQYVPMGADEQPLYDIANGIDPNKQKGEPKEEVASKLPAPSDE